MVKFSLILKAFKPESRKEKLKEFVRRLNSVLLYIKHKENENRAKYALFEGIHIPFGAEWGGEFYST